MRCGDQYQWCVKVHRDVVRCMMSDDSNNKIRLLSVKCSFLFLGGHGLSCLLSGPFPLRKEPFKRHLFLLIMHHVTWKSALTCGKS